MNSIHKKLSRYLSISISILLISILLATDISVDTWISDQFDRAMVNKAGLLETLVKENEDELEFHFAGEFMLEFEGKENPEYFQLWYKNEVFERSDTLELFEIKDLPRLNVIIGGSVFQNITLPDGRAGRMLYTKFLPQIDSELRGRLGFTSEEIAKHQRPMEFAYALSTEELDYVLWFVDVIFIVTSMLAVFAVRKIVKVVVTRSLQPINEFNNQLSRISLNSDNLEVSVETLPQELVPIAKGVNQFIIENHSLYMREQRITSDIAHEIKTPIAELLNLSEVALKFPHEKQITDRLATDVYEISSRLKHIVNSIMLLQKSSSTHELTKSNVNVIELLSNIIDRENVDNRPVNLLHDATPLAIEINKFALDTVLSNLVNNAFFYSPSGTAIDVLISRAADNKAIIKISNISRQECQEADLQLFFAPLWQKDESRTSTERFGLGLAIVKSYCIKLGATISVSLVGQKITFTVSL
ncbi:HAMP domain-containing sensor histidine kinase [Paraglaciecola aquimarina]|uniref:histidine kinase n=1 Tax=Paraglaciecola aquimarina TaxID=1235557 RepID=A0ABU3SRT9_9ALTE|nr:HAMP domain-containing sensor histidine kinase [Paraglaciecola aquimarina]MDU0352698.1 HAMP domain-containing sensor histidine kinase [Paraglaciecola aquimarina]